MFLTPLMQVYHQRNSKRKYFLNIGKSLQRFFLKLTNNFKIHQWNWKDYMQVMKELLSWFVGIKLTHCNIFSVFPLVLQCLYSLAYKTRFHLIFRFPAWSKRNIILTVTAQSNHLLHSKAINKHFFQMETSWKYHKTEQFGFSSQYHCVNEADRMTNSKDPDQTAPQGAVWSVSSLFVSPFCPNT